MIWVLPSLLLLLGLTAIAYGASEGRFLPIVTGWALMAWPIVFFLPKLVEIVR